MLKAPDGKHCNDHVERLESIFHFVLISVWSSTSPKLQNLLYTGLACREIQLLGGYGKHTPPLPQCVDLESIQT